MIEEIRFVNRIGEIEALRHWASTFRAAPLYIYGPEGCGKTRLLKEFVRKFNEYFGEEGIAIYIDALEGIDIKRAIFASRHSKEILDVGIEFSMNILKMGMPLGQALASSISLIIDKVVEKVFARSFRDKYILVAIDDVAKAIGLDRVEWYVKWLYELMWKLYEDYKPKAINFIVTTSEGKSLDLVSRHRHAHVRLIWNLDKKSFEELFYELEPSSKIDFEEVWRLLGGNPGKLIELARQFEWNIYEMKSHYKKLLYPLVLNISREGLIKDLADLLNDVDSLVTDPSPRKGKLQEMLIEKNLIMYVNMTTLHKEEVRPDSEIGVGKYFAWQVPLYRDVIMEIVNELVKR